MDEKRTDFRKLNDAKRALTCRMLGVGLVLYWLFKIVRDYFVGGPDAPDLKLLIIGIVVLGGGSLLVGLISWKAWKLAKENAVMTEEEIAELEALRAGDEAEEEA